MAHDQQHGQAHEPILHRLSRHYSIPGPPSIDADRIFAQRLQEHVGETFARTNQDGVQVSQATEDLHRGHAKMAHDIGNMMGKIAFERNLVRNIEAIAQFWSEIGTGTYPRVCLTVLSSLTYLTSNRGNDMASSDTPVRSPVEQLWSHPTSMLSAHLSAGQAGELEYLHLQPSHESQNLAYIDWHLSVEEEPAQSRPVVNAYDPGDRRASRPDSRSSSSSSLHDEERRTHARDEAMAALMGYTPFPHGEEEEEEHAGPSATAGPLDIHMPHAFHHLD
ncbi:hypothetical protein Rhopal_005495-T1 [Rhodotorula paludigena]|uniref:Uncharacterized protein n=1 Tax=Rhodotorula paludigena TaxID=86838 RepID=A0AAV5GIJ2_9BASI|nr:hypothetical protein Rhopal_005495-T1 [Rhodotorula paludigena]